MGMFKNIVAGLAIAAVSTSVEAQSSKKSSTKSSSSESAPSSAGLPLLTVSGSYEFLKTSAFLTGDLAQFSVLSMTSFVYDQLPPDAQKTIMDVYDDGLSQFDSFRIQNGIPTFSAMKKDALREYEKTVQPPLDSIWKQAKKYAETPNKILKGVVSKFEKEYPASKGLLATDVFDFAFIILFLSYYILDFFVNLFCYFVCCGMCAKRKAKGTPSAVSSKSTTVATKKKKQ